jgi:hypothetical protein
MAARLVPFWQRGDRRNADQACAVRRQNYNEDVYVFDAGDTVSVEHAMLKALLDLLGVSGEAGKCSGSADSRNLGNQLPILFLKHCLRRSVKTWPTILVPNSRSD